MSKTGSTLSIVLDGIQARLSQPLAREAVTRVRAGRTAPLSTMFRRDPYSVLLLPRAAKRTQL
ncbi:hypothetical protein BJV74DRAFT_831686 [Russula compacta]|nr:hypothetical protein BJV74DRAFT_831686 [Russula compacta]